MSQIKFERFADNYMCKDYFYSIWKSNDRLDDRHSTMIKVTMTEYEFKKLFRDMAEELGYYVFKRPSEELEKIIDDLYKYDNKTEAKSYEDFVKDLQRDLIEE